jgi:enoyl-[acyl-carrier protein] reductase III
MWALILGGSSGFGAASARAFAAAGYDIAVVHLDRRGTMPQVEALQAEIAGMGRAAVFYNVNAADDERRAEIVRDLQDRGANVRVLLHSIAFGSLLPFVPPEAAAGEKQAKGASRKQLEMTLDVMANSLVYWSQDLVNTGLLGRGGRIYAMTSSGSHVAWASYGPVAAAKACLEAYCRQLALELAPRGITTNAILAGVTRTPAVEKIAGAQKLLEGAQSRNPFGRLTEPDDVARALVLLASQDSHWINGNVLRIDGGEDVCG